MNYIDDAVDELKEQGVTCATLTAHLQHRRLSVPDHVRRWYETLAQDAAEQERLNVAEHVLYEMRRLHRQCPCDDCRLAGFQGARLPTMRRHKRWEDFEGDF